MEQTIWKHWIPYYNSLEDTRLEDKAYSVDGTIAQLSETNKKNCASKEPDWKIKSIDILCTIGTVLSTSKNEILVELRTFRDSDTLSPVDYASEDIVYSLARADRLALTRPDNDNGSWRKSIEEMGKFRKVLREGESQTSLDLTIKWVKGIEDASDDTADDESDTPPESETDSS